jgi:hypothetical protein
MNKILLLKIILALFLVSLLGWFVAGQYESARRVVYIIPPGVGSGQVTLDVPDEIILTLGVKDTIVIENRDNVIHTFGPFVVAPQTTMTHRFYHVMNYEGVCTFHRERQMKVVVNPAPWQLHFFYTED